jgi:anaerobic selenocysteine-containing dehydrogenase
MLPGFHMDRADFLLGFGADFLETWLSPVEYARKFKAMHGYRDGNKGMFVQVSPLQTLTAANADRWIGCRPGAEAAVILGLIRGLAESEQSRKINKKVVKALAGLLDNFSSDTVAEVSGVSVADQTMLVKRLAEAKQPLVLGTGASGEGDHAAAAELAALLLNLTLDPDLSLFDFKHRHRVEIADTRSTVLEAFASMERNKTAVVFLNNVNPVYAIPGSGKIGEMLASDKRFTVAFANFMDETASVADLVFPVQMALETWDAYESNPLTLSAMQPTMGKITQPLLWAM